MAFQWRWCRFPRLHLLATMSDFLSREADFLGGEFSSSHKTDIGSGDDIDFERAASAFPDISLEGIGDIPTPALAAQTNSSFSFDDFDSPLEKDSAVKVTGNDELEKFQNEFPDIQVPQVCHAGHCVWRTDSLAYVICTHVSAFLFTRRGSPLFIVLHVLQSHTHILCSIVHRQSLNHLHSRQPSHLGPNPLHSPLPPF